MTSYFPATQRALTRQARLVANLVAGLDPAPAPTRLDGWNTTVLIGHLAAGLETLWRWRATDIDGLQQIDEVDYWTMAAGFADGNTQWAQAFASERTPDEITALLAADVEKAIDAVQAAGGDEWIAVAGSGSWLTLDAFAQTRVMELTIHGFDLQHAADLPLEADDTALGITAVTLERRLAGPRPDDLADPIAWVEAATGRRGHPDPRLPVLR